MGRRALFLGLVAAASAADAAGAHGLAYWALLAALPVAAACGLASFGSFLDDGDDVVTSLQALLWIPALALLLAAAAARGPALASAGAPRLGVTALLGCLAVLALKAVVFAGAELLRGRALAPAAVKPAR